MSWYPYASNADRAARTPDGRDRSLNNPDPALRGRSCCERASVRFCVCYISYTCPEHGTTCVGTHD